MNRTLFDTYLSPPYMSGNEQELINAAVASGWIAPHGPQLEEFEQAIARRSGVPFALAVHSGTAALHLALLAAGVRPGDRVLCPTFTFAALPSMISLTGATPVFVDCDELSWNISLPLVNEYFEKAADAGILPRAMILVHNYGIMADAPAFRQLCDEYGVVMIEDAAGAFGSTFELSSGVLGSAGSFGHYGALSFNGNKLITALGGGALLLHSKEQYDLAKKLSLQSREPGAAYEHLSPGFNYRMNNVAAAFGLAQLTTLDWRVERKRSIRRRYQEALGEAATFQRSLSEGDTAWLSAVDLHTDWRPVFENLKQMRIESRPLWKPLHLQPAYGHCQVVGGEVAERLFETGLCLPSGLGLAVETQQTISKVVADGVKKPMALRTNPFLR